KTRGAGAPPPPTPVFSELFNLFETHPYHIWEISAQTQLLVVSALAAFSSRNIIHLRRGT
ncbi:MAG: hypothetical protein AB1649_28370, partial [Chloroflexota bacterium]